MQDHSCTEYWRIQETLVVQIQIAVMKIK